MSALRLTPLVVFAACAVPGDGSGAAADLKPRPPWIELFDGASLAGFAPTNFGGEGEVVVDDGAIVMDFGSPLTGVTWTGEPPRGDYELEVTAARLDGVDFFCGLTFPVQDAHLTLVLGGWGGSVCGLSSLDGDDASRNETRTVRGFEQGRDYTVRVQVTQQRVDVQIDGEPFLSAPIAERRLSLRPEVLLCRPLGVASFLTRARIRSLRWRPSVAAPR